MHNPSNPIIGGCSVVSRDTNDIKELNATVQPRRAFNVIAVITQQYQYFE